VVVIRGVTLLPGPISQMLDISDRLHREKEVDCRLDIYGRRQGVLHVFVWPSRSQHLNPGPVIRRGGRTYLEKEI
jgi:hypothetical protein